MSIYNHIPAPQSFHNRSSNPPSHLNLTSKQAKNWRRATKKSMFNEELRKKYPPLQVKLSDFQIIFVDRATCPDQLQFLQEATANASCFSIDQESTLQFNPVTYQNDTIPSLIQGNILDGSKIIRGWGDPFEELSSYVPYQMFKQSQLYRTRKQREESDIQSQYTTWTEGWVALSGRDPNMDGDNQNDEIIIHAPSLELEEKGSLQKALSNTYQLLLDKTWTKSKWSAGLNRRLATYIDSILSGVELDRNTIVSTSKDGRI
ncbi:unnamed protein product [Didymodactylos carnosus]|uniref:Uncharacterized protein n=1 Tax=Didymodactylos carnosus TaxID=1234261 RepID=A0A814T8V5_9BILA|nr:unnamed protein product [Didymodactylos carnosus]CAF3920939.1 unnamed protein product [Didymodactylos carnosus]